MDDISPDFRLIMGKIQVYLVKLSTIVRKDLLPNIEITIFFVLLDVMHHKCNSYQFE